jgi:hypothetical protein
MWEELASAERPLYRSPAGSSWKLLASRALGAESQSQSQARKPSGGCADTGLGLQGEVSGSLWLAQNRLLTCCQVTLLQHQGGPSSPRAGGRGS